MISRRLVIFRKQKRNAKTDPHGKTVRRQQIGLKSRQLLAFAGGLERQVDLFADIAEQVIDRLSLHCIEPIAGYLRRRRIKGINVAVEIGRDQAGADRFDDAFVQDAQIGERFRGFLELLARRTPVGQSRREQADDQQRDDVKADDLNRLSRGLLRAEGFDHHRCASEPQE